VDQLAPDPEGNILIADPGNHMVSRLNPDGTLAALAGNGIAGFSGNGGPARDASLNSPRAAMARGIFCYDECPGRWLSAVELRCSRQAKSRE